MLEVVKNYSLEVFTFVHSAYSSPSRLYLGDKILESSIGVQQGVPLGPLFFCLYSSHRFKAEVIVTCGHQNLRF